MKTRKGKAIKKKPQPAAYHAYVLRCSDGTLYAGIATDIERRLGEHNGSKKGARYTRARRPVELLRSWGFGSRSEALREEARIKRMSREEKLALIYT